MAGQDGILCFSPADILREYNEQSSQHRIEKSNQQRPADTHNPKGEKKKNHCFNSLKTNKAK